MGSCRSSGASCSPRGSPGVQHTGGRPVNNRSNRHGIRVLPLFPRQRGNVLPDKSSNDSLIIEDLEGQHRVASLVRSIIELEVVISHTKETEVIIPIRGHVGLRLCEGDADQVVRCSSLDQKTISSTVALPVARAPSSIADYKRVDKVGRGEPRRLPHPHVLHVHWLFCEVVVGHVNITLEEDGLNPSNVPGIVIDHIQGGVGGIRISMSKELSITVSNGLPSSRGSV